MTPRRRTPTAYPVRRVDAGAGAPSPDGTAPWPLDVPAVRQLLREGLDLGALMVLVGENGSGKSTLVEGIAMAYGLSCEGGSTFGQHSSRASESPLGQWLRLTRNPGSSRWGFFLRAETMHGYYTYAESLGPTPRPEPVYHELSHGESFLAVLQNRFDGPGLYVLDEPESALSFSGCLALVAVLLDLARSGTAQALVATHSPVVAALPGARILEVGPWGLRESAWEELEVVGHWRQFLDAPQRYLRHLT